MTEQIFFAKQNQNIKEALTGALSILNIRHENRAILLKPEQEMAIYSLLYWRDLMAILSTGFGKSTIITVFAMAKEEMSSSKTCTNAISPLKSIIDDQISEMLSLSCTAKEPSTEKVICFEKVHLNFLCYSVLENNALFWTVSTVVVDESHTVEERRTA